MWWPKVAQLVSFWSMSLACSGYSLSRRVVLEMPRMRAAFDLLLLTLFNTFLMYCCSISLRLSRILLLVVADVWLFPVRLAMEIPSRFLKK